MQPLERDRRREGSTGDSRSDLRVGLGVQRIRSTTRQTDGLHERPSARNVGDACCLFALRMAAHLVLYRSWSKCVRVCIRECWRARFKRNYVGFNSDAGTTNLAPEFTSNPLVLGVTGSLDMWRPVVELAVKTRGRHSEIHDAGLTDLRAVCAHNKGLEPGARVLHPVSALDATLRETPFLSRANMVRNAFVTSRRHCDLERTAAPARMLRR